MKRWSRLAGLFLVLTLLPGLIVACGGLETDRANLLVAEVNQIDIAPGLEGAGLRISEATSSLTTGQQEAAAADLAAAQQYLDTTIAEIEKASSKLDEAASMNVNEEFSGYLEVKSDAMEAALAIAEASKGQIAALLADLAMEKPETYRALAELEQTATQQAEHLQAKENEASQLAAASEDIK